MPKPICCSSLVLDVLDSHKLVLDRGGHHPALVCAAPRAAQTCAFWIWLQIQRPNSNFLYFLLVRVTRVKWTLRFGDDPHIGRGGQLWAVTCSRAQHCKCEANLDCVLDCVLYVVYCTNARFFGWNFECYRQERFEHQNRHALAGSPILRVDSSVAHSDEGWTKDSKGSKTAKHGGWSW